MNKNLSVVLKWSPRIFGIVLLSLLLLLSYDVFEIEASFFELVLAFLGHNVPFFILLVAFIISWKKDLVGAISFFLATTTLIIFLGVSRGFPLIFNAYSLILLGYGVSILFFLNFYYTKKTKY